ncbi:MAG: FAD-dependent oxidoreductase [Anaerolineae bacterium]
MPRTVSEPARDLPIAAEVDVLVAGGGPAGFAAAVAAAREGARTLLLERYGFLGGLATAGLVAPILGHTAADSDTPIVEGLLRQLTERMHALGGAPHWEEALPEWGIRFDAEALKYAADSMAIEAGVRLLFHTLVVGVLRDGERIAGVVVESKSGRQAIAAKVVVDATGDADVAARAGAPWAQGRAFDGAVQSMGSFFHLAGIRGLSPAAQQRVTEQVRQAMAEGRFRFYNPGFLGINTMHRDYFSPNMTRLPGDPTDANVLTNAEIDARRQVWELLRFLREEVEGCQDAYILATAPQVGARESRQIRGLHTLSGGEVATAAKFAAAIARGSWWIDIHCPLGHTYPVHLCEQECSMGERCGFWAAEHERMLPHAGLFPPKGDWYDIPYGCLVPRDVANLLVAGRSISATHEAMAGARVMGTCMAIGEAAGVAAALAAAGDGVTAAVDVPLLRERLAERGALV